MLLLDQMFILNQNPLILILCTLHIIVWLIAKEKTRRVLLLHHLHERKECLTGVELLKTFV